MKEFKGFKKGINLGGWLSQCDYSEDNLNRFIVESDIEKIAGWGLDHVRIPFDYNIIQNPDGSIKDDAFVHLDRALDWCEKYGLNAILDLHKTLGFSFDYYGESESGFFDSDRLQGYFYGLWNAVSARYGHLSERVAFELLNEITDKEYMQKWNEISKKCISAIRKNAPDTFILIGGYWNNSPESVKDLDKPYDEKIVYNMHCYDPLKFTHQGAYWTDLIKPDERVAFEDSGIDENYFIGRFKEAVAAAEANNVSLYCGEYGVINIVSPEDTIKWYKAINGTFEKLGISRSAWNYREKDFGITDERLSSVVNELVKLL